MKLKIERSTWQEVKENLAMYEAANEDLGKICLELHDAAEFERRVAIWLAQFHARHNNIFGHASKDDCIHPVFHGRGECAYCGECYLKWARINVEAEMDGGK